MTSARTRGGFGRRLPSKARLLVALLFVATIGWLVAAVGAGAVLRNGQPDRALGFAPWDARAAARAAERGLTKGGADPSSLRQAGALARNALSRDATVVPAWRLMGLLEVAAKREGRAAGLFHMSERLSRRDLPTQLWLIEESVKRNDVPDALRHYDIALRTNPRSHDMLMPILVAAAGAPQTASDLGRLLATRPLWAGNFYYRLGQSPAATAPDPAHVARMLAIARRGGPFANEGVLRGLLESMVERGAYQPALHLFGTLSGQAARSPKTVRNGTFEGTNDFAPMDWDLSGEVDLGAEARAGVGGRGNALVVWASTDRNGVVARQILMLPPGSYRLRYKAGRTQASAPSRLEWRIACAGTEAFLLSGPVIPGATAIARETGFRIPAGCAAQWLSLDIGSTDPAGSEAWVDDVGVARAGG